MTLTPGSPYGDGRDDDDLRTRSSRTRRVPTRVALLAGLLLLIVLLTATGSTRDWWAHRLHDMTGGDETANYVIGLLVGLLPVIGVGIGAIRTRGARRIYRMMVFGAAGFIVTYLLAPSPARYLADHSSRAVYDELAPGYLAGVFTAALVWFAALVVAVVLARKWWRRATARFRQPDPGSDPTHRVIDV